MRLPEGHRDELHLGRAAQQAPGQLVRDVDVKADILAGSVDGTEGREVRLDADDDLAAGLDALERGLGRGRGGPDGGETDGAHREQKREGGAKRSHGCLLVDQARSRSASSRVSALSKASMVSSTS